MGDNTGLRKAIRDVTGWSRQNLYYHQSAIVKKYGVAPRDDALYALALQHGISLDKYGLDHDTQRRASDVFRMVADGNQGGNGGTAPTSEPRRARAPTQMVSITANDRVLGDLPSSTTKYLKGNHKRSAEAYRLLYLVENSARETIMSVLKQQHGKNWWKVGVDPRIGRRAANRKKDDAQDPWHTPRGEHDIYYIDLYDYAQIMTSDANWPLFEPIFKRKSFVIETLHQITVSRRVVAHMNGLKAEDFDQLQTNYLTWMKVLKAHESGSAET